MSNPALIDELEKQFRDNPRRMFARLANEYRKSGDFMRAIEICSAHVPAQPGYISGHIVLGQALYDAGELEQAQDTFQTALSLDPENLIALRQLGDIARSRRDYGNARSWYTKLLEVDPQNDEVVAQLGELALLGGHDGRGNGHRESSLTSTPTGQEGVMTPGAGYEATPDASAAPPLEISDDEDSDASFADDELPALEGQNEFEVEESFGSAQPISDTVPDETPNLSSDDEEVSWIAADDEADEEEFRISGFGSAGDSLSSGEAGTELDFILESEEDEPPLRPHTGESLAIIEEEDPLAGVLPLHGSERSPFGDPVDATAGDDAAEMTMFEPLPTTDIDAAAEVTPVAPVGGVPLLEELAQWTEEQSEEEPAGESAEVGSADDRPDAVHESFEVSEAETLLEDPDSDFSWGEPRQESPEMTVDADSETSAAESTTDEFSAAIADSSSLPVRSGNAGWEAVAPAASSGESSDDAPVEFEPAADVPVSKDEAGDSSDEPTPAFVTETMAELYLQQGFRSQALEVYRSLAAQSPDDSRLSDRVAQLEQGSSSVEAVHVNGSGAGSARQPEHTSAAAFFKRLASVPVPGASPIVESRTKASQDWAEAALSGAGEVSEEDDQAAKALASGYTQVVEPAPRRPSAATRAAKSAMSLDDIFGANEQQARGTPIGSLDAFFTPEGERVSGESAPESSGDIDDLQAFNAWLDGLKK